MKKIIYHLFLILEVYKIELLAKIFGSEYLCKSLFLCRSDNLKNILTNHGAFVGHNVQLKPMLSIDNYAVKNQEFSNIIIKDKVYIGKNVFFDLANKIVIENDVVISGGVSILTHADVGDRKMKRYYQRVCNSVKIGEASWIGANATILSGVTIGKYCVIAAGSVVVSDVADYTMVAGTPAIVKKQLQQ